MSNESKLIEAAKALCDAVDKAVCYNECRAVLKDCQSAIAEYQPEPVITAEHWRQSCKRHSVSLPESAFVSVHRLARELAIESAKKHKYSAAEYREMARIVANSSLADMLEQAASALGEQS